MIFKKPQMKELKIEEAIHLTNKFEISLKVDGTLIFYKNKNLYSHRGILRNERFNHILKLLRDNDFPECMGEMHIKGGKVFDVSRRENWKNAAFMIFQADNRQELFDKINKLATDYIIKPLFFDDLISSWNYVLENKEEGLVLKNSNNWFKIKKLIEIKEKIKEHEAGRNKGTFILQSGNRISGTSLDYVNRFKVWEKEGKSVFAEVEFAYRTDSGRYFQPRMRRIYCET